MTKEELTKEITPDEDGYADLRTPKWFTEEEILEEKGVGSLSFYGNNDFTYTGCDDDKGGCPIMLIKGTIITPKPTKVVTKLEVE
jgi:hypothetical protein